MRLNLLLLLFVAFLPFPTRLVAGALDDIHEERVYATMYGLTLLGIRIFGFLLDEYALRERLYSKEHVSAELEQERRTILPVVGGYVIAILVGLVAPRVAVGVYCVDRHLPRRAVPGGPPTAVRALLALRR